MAPQQAPIDPPSVMQVITSGDAVAYTANTPYASSNITTVSGTGSVLIMNDNPNRKGFMLYNNSSNSIYIVFGATASSNACSAIIASFTQFIFMSPYVGKISGIRNAGTGNVIVTEFIQAA